MKRKSIIGLIILFIASALFAENTIEGAWDTGKDNTIVEMYKQGGKWYGKIISSDNERDIIGMDLILDCVWKKNAWQGLLYLPLKDREVDARFIPTEKQLEITISKGLLKKTIYWERSE